jgi:molecular chaperone GrpE
MNSEQTLNEDGDVVSQKKPENLELEQEIDGDFFDDLESDESSAENLKKEYEAKIAEVNDRMLRIAADFENSRKRWDRERIEARQYAIQEFAKDLLPVIDSFDNAMKAIDSAAFDMDSETGKKVGSIVEGVKLVQKAFSDSLKKHGVEKLPAKGEPFNPMHHNAVAKVVDDSVTQETVVDEFVSGYKIADRVLRTAMVRVATPD